MSTTLSVLSPEEKIKLLSYSGQINYRDYIMIKLALLTGIRNSECVQLTVFCIAPYGTVYNYLEIPNVIAKRGQGRSLPLHPDLKHDLTEFLSWKFKNKEEIETGSALFVSARAKKQLNTRDFHRIVYTHSLNSIGRPIHPHTLRHTFATELLSKSNLAIVQEALGHKSIQSTQIYLHPSTNDVLKAINQL